MSSTIKASNVSLSYRGKPAFKDVSLTVPRGVITALIGPSGCGKTSFLMCLNRLTDLIPGCSVFGDIHIGDVSILDPSTDPISLRRRVGMIFQKPNPFPLSIRKNLELPLREHGIKNRELVREMSEKVLKDVGLWGEVKDRMEMSALMLSGGQQQRLCVARALVLSPDVLLMDEPCSALDPISGGVVEDLISRLRGRYTVLVVTHNLAQARRIADNVAFFWVHESSGVLVEHGHTKQIFESPAQTLTSAYITGARG